MGKVQENHDEKWEGGEGNQLSGSFKPLLYYFILQGLSFCESLGPAHGV